MPVEKSEIWVDIVGYEGYYQISSHGRVRSLDRYITYPSGRVSNHKGIILAQFVSNAGYLFVRLSKDNACKTLYVHMLSWDSFSNSPRLGKHIDHIDNNKLNNHFSNLQLLLARENIVKGIKRNFTNLTGATAFKGKWQSRIVINGKRVFIGSFSTELEAHNAYTKELTRISNI